MTALRSVEELRAAVRTAWYTGTDDFRKGYDKALFALLDIGGFQDLFRSSDAPQKTEHEIDPNLVKNALAKAQSNLVTEAEAYGYHILAELRAQGLRVAVHNDYEISGVLYTFWLFTEPGGMSHKGEGLSDLEALLQVKDSLDKNKPV